jgi:hypothetical protein
LASLKFLTTLTGLPPRQSFASAPDLESIGALQFIAKALSLKKE